MRKILCYLMLLLGVIGLVSCDNGSSDEEGDGDLVFNENGEVVYNNVLLKMFSVTTGDDASTQDSIIEEFNELYEGFIKVEVEHISRYDLESSLQSIMEFDRVSAPDIIFNHGARTKEYAENEWIQAIDVAYEKGNLYLDSDDFVESLLESTTVDGRVYAIPQDVHSAMIEIRTDILEKNGLKIPQNYKELVEVCESAIKLASEGNLWIRGENSDGYDSSEWRKASRNKAYEPFPIAYGDMWVHEFLGYTAAIQNGSVLTDSDGYPGWNTNETANGLQVLRDFFYPTTTSTNKTALSKDYGADYDVGYSPFLRGECIFKLNGPWEYQKEIDEFDVLLRKDGGSANITTVSLSKMFALDTSKEYASKIKGEGHAIMLSSTVTSMTKKCATAVFADYMAYNSGITWAARGHLPAVVSVENSAEYRESVQYQSYIKNWGSCNDYVVYPPTQYYSMVDSYFKNALQKAMSGTFIEQSIKNILNEEAEDCIDYIELYL